MADQNATELAIIEASYRLVSDATAYEDMIGHWADRIDALEDDALAALNTPLLVRHIDNAMGLLDRYDSGRVADPVAEAVREVAVPAVVVTTGNRIVEANSGAGEQWGVRSGEISELDWIDSSSRQTFDEMRESALRTSNRSHAILRIFGSDSEPRLAECYMLKPSGAGAAMLAIRELNLSWNADVSALLSEAFSLTRAEIDICRLMLSVRNTGRIAEQRSSSIRTVRTQLQAIFGKTDTATQVDLIRLLSMVCARVQTGNRSSGTEWEDPFGHEEIFTDNNGRQVAYSWTGDPEGRPALFVHGLATGYALPADGLDELKRRGIKLFVISRPGFGHSESAPLARPAEAAADAIEALAEHLYISSWSVIGIASGIIPVVHAAHRSSARIDSILGVASFLPFSSRETFAHLAPARRVALRLAKVSQVFANWVGQVGYRMMKNRDADFLVKTLCQDCEADRQATRSAESPALLRSGQRLLIHRDHRAFASDLRMLATDWSHVLDSCPVPIHFLHGEQDPLNPIQRLRAFTDARPDFILDVVPDAGELVYYAHSRRIVASLDRAMKAAALAVAA